MKTRSQTATKKATDAELDKLAAMADKPYKGTKGATKEKEPMVRCNAMLPESMMAEVGKLVGRNLIGGSGPTSTSSVVREAMAMYLASQKD